MTINTRFRDERNRPTPQGLLFASFYGAVVAVIGFAIARGDLVGAVIVMIIIGVLSRLTVYAVIRRRGGEQPAWWKWL